MRNKIYTDLDDLQLDLDIWLEHFNNEILYLKYFSNSQNLTNNQVQNHGLHMDKVLTNMRNTEFVEYVKEIFEAITEVRIKAMFGGYGIYNKQLMIGLIVDNELYLKADLVASAYFKSLGSKQFTYKRQDKFIKMSYWQVLPEVLEDIELFTKWYNLAIKSAMGTI